MPGNSLSLCSNCHTTQAHKQLQKLLLLALIQAQTKLKNFNWQLAKIENIIYFYAFALSVAITQT